MTAINELEDLLTELSTMEDDLSFALSPKPSNANAKKEPDPLDELEALVNKTKENDKPVEKPVSSSNTSTLPSVRSTATPEKKLVAVQKQMFSDSPSSSAPTSSNPSPNSSYTSLVNPRNTNPVIPMPIVNSPSAANNNTYGTIPTPDHTRNSLRGVSPLASPSPTTTSTTATPERRGTTYTSPATTPTGAGKLPISLTPDPNRSQTSSNGSSVYSSIPASSQFQSSSYLPISAKSSPGGSAFDPTRASVRTQNMASVISEYKTRPSITPEDAPRSNTISGRAIPNSNVYGSVKAPSPTPVSASQQKVDNRDSLRIKPSNASANLPPRERIVVLEREYTELQEKMDKITKLKQKATEKEDYEGASQLKTLQGQVDEAMRNKLTEIDKIRLQIVNEEVPKPRPVSTVMPTSLDELERLKKEAIAREEYDKAQQYKEQIERIERANRASMRGGQAEYESKRQELEKLKKQAIADENYLLANQIKEQIDKLDKQYGVPSSSNSFVSNQSNDQSRLEQINKLRTAHEAKRADLERLKKESILNEDYPQASYYKEQIELLEATFATDIARLNGQSSAKSTSNTLPTSTAKAYQPPSMFVDNPNSVQGTVREKKPTKKQYPQDSRLYNAARVGREEEVKQLLNELDVNAIDFNSGNTALHGFAEVGRVEMIKYLVEHGADVTIKNRRGQTVLHITVERRIDRATEYLISECGSNPTDPDNTGKTPLDYAGAAPQYQGELKEFISQKKREKGSNPIVASNSGNVASNVGVEVVKIFLKNGINQTAALNENHTSSEVIQQICAKYKWVGISSHLELVEDVMGKERKLRDDEKVLQSKDKWPNDNDKYCKFIVKPKRGAPEEAQMKYRETLYGK